MRRRETLRRLSDFARGGRGIVDGTVVVVVLAIFVALFAWGYYNDSGRRVGYVLVAAAHREASKFKGMSFEEAAAKARIVLPSPEEGVAVAVVAEDAGPDAGRITVIATAADGGAAYRYSFALPKGAPVP